MTNEYRPYAGEHDAKQAFRDSLDLEEEYVTVAGISYPPSRVLENVSPIDFQTTFNNWLDALQRDLPDDDEDED
jgi:hypothetical protein